MPLHFLLTAAAAPVGKLLMVCDTSVAVGDGSFTVELHPEWAPRGVERVVELRDAQVERESEKGETKEGTTGRPAAWHKSIA